MIDKFLTILESGNDNALLRYSLGNAYFSEKRYDEAIEHLTKAVEQDSSYSAAWKLLGRSYYELKQYQSAVDTYDKGLAVAADKGDKQAEKEMRVFCRRAVAARDNGL